MTDQAYMLQELQKLVGTKVISVELATFKDDGTVMQAHPQDHEARVFITFEKDGKRLYSVLAADPEGNGPGWLSVEDA